MLAKKPNFLDASFRSKKLGFSGSREMQKTKSPTFWMQI